MRAYNAVVSCIVSVFLVSAAVADDSLWNMSMPTIESPSLGTGFYTPSAAASPYMSGRSNVSSPSTESKSTHSSPTSTPSAASPENAVSSQTPLSRSLRNSISARDMEAMDSLGLLGGLSGILSEGYSSSLYSRTAAGADRTEETNRLLTRVLEKMEELKEQGEARSSATVEAQATLVSDEGAAASSATSSTPAGAGRDSHGKSRSRLLRFAVNGYNVLRTCRTVYISDVQDDGTFLVTGDRRYVSDGQTRSETFHILFKTKPDTSLLSEYDAATAVTQDSYNPNSFVYQLSKRKNMMASRTGNLVSMRTEDPDWRLELLIDLGE